MIRLHIRAAAHSRFFHSQGVLLQLFWWSGCSMNDGKVSVLHQKAEIAQRGLSCIEIITIYSVTHQHFHESSPSILHTMTALRRTLKSRLNWRPSLSMAAFSYAAHQRRAKGSASHEQRELPRSVRLLHSF